MQCNKEETERTDEVSENFVIHVIDRKVEFGSRVNNTHFLLGFEVLRLDNLLNIFE